MHHLCQSFGLEVCYWVLNIQHGGVWQFLHADDSTPETRETDETRETSSLTGGGTPLALYQSRGSEGCSNIDQDVCVLCGLIYAAQESLYVDVG